MDLPLVKKIIISILNINPDGIYADKIDAEFQKAEGCKIPWSQFGYTSLLTFLKNELANEIQIDDSNSWNIMLYPIANARSGHILKLKEKDIKNRDEERRRR